MIGIGMPDLVIFVNTRNYNDPGCNHTFLENSPQNNRQRLAIKVQKLHWKGCPCTRQGCKMSNIMDGIQGPTGRCFQLRDGSGSGIVEKNFGFRFRDRSKIRLNI